MKWNTVKDSDLGFDEMIELFNKLDSGDVVVEVGVPADKNYSEDGVSMALVASANEYGTERIPERSFLRSTIDENKNYFAEFLGRRLGEVIDRKRTIGQALDALGLKTVSMVKKKMVDLDDPPNADSTIRQKKSSNPLINQGDAGGLKGAIIHRVRGEND